MRKNQRQKNREYWLKQLEDYGDYPGSQRAYCRATGIAFSKFSYWKNKVSKEGPKTRAKEGSPFVPVVMESPRFKPGQIDAKWVAEFILHLGGGVR